MTITRNHNARSSPVAVILSAASCALVLACGPIACSSPDTSPSAGRGDSYPAPMNDPQISVLDPVLRDWIAFQPGTITHEGGVNDRITDIQVPVRNLTERVYEIEYRYLWFDSNGRQIEPLMGWTFARLDPKQVVRLDGNASLVDARDYRLEVRWSR